MREDVFMAVVAIHLLLIYFQDCFRKSCIFLLLIIVHCVMRAGLGLQ